MRIIGFGMDLVEVGRIAEMLNRHGSRFLDRCFTEAERHDSGRSVARQHERLAARFAAKEAVLKALGTGWRDGIAWTDIETVRQPSGQPVVRLSGAAARIATDRGINQWQMTLTHTSGFAMAGAIGMAADD